MMRMYWINSIDPFTDLSRLEEWMDQTLEQVLSSFTSESQSNGFTPAVDVLDGVDHLTVKAAIPGLDPNAINASYTNGILQITIGKRAEAKPKQIPITVANPQLAEKATA